MKTRFISACFLVLALSCASTKPQSSRSFDLWDLSELGQEELLMANDLLSYGLEHEALYSLLDTLKPISSLGYSLSYPIAKDAVMKDGEKEVVAASNDSIRLILDEINQWNRITSALSNDEFTFLLIPFKQPWQGKRNMQLLVVRNMVFKRLMKRKASFFAQWGFTADADPATVLTAIEFESKNDRFRAYGYLFGYPEYAVDFFIQASTEEEETGEFIKRDFFHIPVATGQQGNFTYAIPKDHQPTSTDSVIYNKASQTLSKYKQLKNRCALDENSIDAIQLISQTLSVANKN